MNRNSTYPFMNQAELIELIDGCLKEDRRTQELLYKRYSNRMWGVCLRYSRSREEAEDILQEGFMKVFDNIGKFKFEGSFEGWVRRIMVNTALRHYSRSVFKEELAGDDEEIDSLVDPQALVNISEKELLRVIDELPEGYRIVFNLYVIEGYDHKEVAAMLGIAESTSRSQLAKARLMLQKRLNKDKKQNKLFLFFLMTAGTDPFDEVVRRKLVNYSPDAPPHIWNNIVEQRSFYYRMMRLLRRNGLTFGLILLVSGLLAGISYSFISGERAYAQRNEAPQHLLAYHADDQSMEQGNPEDIFSDNAEAGSTPASFAAFSGNNGSYERESGKKRAHGKEAGAEKSGDADLQARKERITKSRKDGKGSTAKNNNALNRIIDDIAGAINGNQGKANIFQNAALASNDPLINSMLGAGRLKSSQSMKTSGNDPGGSMPGKTGNGQDSDVPVYYASVLMEGFVPVTPQLPGATIDSIGGGENGSLKEPVKTGRETWVDRLTIYAVGSPLLVKKSIRAADEANNDLSSLRSSTEKMKLSCSAGFLGELRITQMISARTGIIYTRFTSNFDYTVTTTGSGYVYSTDTFQVATQFEPQDPVIVHDSTLVNTVVNDRYVSANSYTSWNIPLLMQSQFEYGGFRFYSSLGPMVNVSFTQRGILVNSDRQVVDINAQDTYRKSFNLLLYAGAGCRYAATRRMSLMVEPHYTYNLNSVTRKGSGLDQNFHTWGMMLGIGIDL